MVLVLESNGHEEDAPSLGLSWSWSCSWPDVDDDEEEITNDMDDGSMEA
jgi:hypothetical protein